MAAGIDGHSLEVHPSSIEVNVMFKTIVVGVDGREGGRDALALA